MSGKEGLIAMPGLSFPSQLPWVIFDVYFQMTHVLWGL